MQQSALIRALGALASLKLTLVILALLAVGIVTAYFAQERTTLALVLPLVLLSLNLLAAVMVNPTFRRQTPLLVFHLALIGIVLLVAAGRMMYLKGQLELAEGETFTGELTAFEAGPWHLWKLDRVRFTNLGFRIDYAPGVVRGRTENHVGWVDQAGQAQDAVIGDHRPLVLGGYRFYTTFNKGFALVFLWQPRHGAAVRGRVNLPSYPANEYAQARAWQPPGSGLKLWTALAFDEKLLDPDQPWSFRTPTRHKVVVRLGDEGAPQLRSELRPGERLAVGEGELVYEGITTWMGYHVFHDWTIPWLLAASVVGVLSLGWHFWAKFGVRSWRGEEAEANGT